jgi:putative lipoic acid-binding regulatory protein
MKISDAALKWLGDATKDLKDPVIAVVERVYRG